MNEETECDCAICQLRRYVITTENPSSEEVRPLVKNVFEVLKKEMSEDEASATLLLLAFELKLTRQVQMVQASASATIH